MSVLLFSHPACLGHVPGPGHPERVERLEAVLAALAADGAPAVVARSSPAATREQLARVHAAAHIAHILDGGPREGLRALDPDTVMSPGSATAALHAAGAACAAVDAVCTGEAARAFCAIRPPGHHATADQAMGFCLFNNVAVAAAHALAVHGFARVAIADFDVHHGNGSEDIFRDEPRVLYASSHQMPLYPGTGDPAGNTPTIRNAALPRDSGTVEFRAAWREELLPAMHAFAPQLVLVSAGFDADARDPLAGLGLGPDDFAWLTRELVALAERHAGGRLVSLLEGGYDLAALAEDACAHVRALDGETPAR